MKKILMDLQRFSGSLTLTKYNDAGYSTCSASASSSLAEDDEVTMTIVFASGYEFDECEVIAGGCTYNPTTKKIKMGASNAVVYFKSKKSTIYKVLENCMVNVNGTKTEIKRNMTLEKAPNGGIYNVKSDGTDLASVSADAVKQLVAAGAIVKI